MSRHGRKPGLAPRDLRVSAGAFCLSFLAAWGPTTRALAQEPERPAAPVAPAASAPRATAPMSPPATPAAQPVPGPTPGVPMPPRSPVGAAVVGPILTPEGHGPETTPAFDPSIQIVRFHGPRGLAFEVLAPSPAP
ncbi:MAG: hypothetical protein U0790_26105, partial [Isosphaeraceae bacterium]